MTAPCRRLALIVLLTATATAGPLRAPVAHAGDWRPERLTIVLGHDAGGSQGRAVEALAAAWSRALGVPVTVAARGRASALRAAREFIRGPRDGKVVLAGDIGALALAYARDRTTWTWAQSFEHLGLYALDPAVLFVSARSGIMDVDDVVTVARARRYPVAVDVWNSLENLVLKDAAVQARLKFDAVPAGSGPSLVNAVTGGGVRLAFGRLSTIARERGAVQVLAAAALGGTAAGGFKTLDAAFGVVTPPAGRFDAISVHADFQRTFPARHETLKRSFEAARDDAGYRDALQELGLGVERAASIDHAALIGAVRGWWDAVARVGTALDAPPPEIHTRGKLTRVGEDGRLLHYLGLDGKIHEMHADPEFTAVGVAGGGDTLKALKAGMICAIDWPSPVATEASRLSCK